MLCLVEEFVSRIGVNVDDKKASEALWVCTCTWHGAERGAELPSGALDEQSGFLPPGIGEPH